MATTKTLDPRLLPFIDAYIEAVFAGKKRPDKVAADSLGIDHTGLLRRHGVMDEISKRINNYLSLADVDKVQVLLELKKSAFSSIGDVLDFDGEKLTAKSFEEIKKNNPDALDSIQSIKQNSFGEVEVKMYNKVDSLKELASIFNMKTTTVNLNHGIQKPGLFDDVDFDNDEEETRVVEEALETPVADVNLETPAND